MVLLESLVPSRALELLTDSTSNALLGCREAEGYDRVTAKRINLAAGASKEVVIWNLEMEREIPEFVGVVAEQMGEGWR